MMGIFTARRGTQARPGSRGHAIGLDAQPAQTPASQVLSPPAEPTIEPRALGGQFSIRALSPSELASAVPDFQALAFAECVRRGVAAVRLDAMPHLVVTDPRNSVARTWAFLQCPEFSRAIAHVSGEDFAAWISTWEDRIAALDLPEAVTAVEAEVPEAAETLTLAGIGGESNAVVRFVNSTLFDALKSGASDVHLEADASGLSVKFRLDGVLAPIGRLNGVTTAGQVISRIKVMSELDIAEHRIPQDGRLSVTFKNRPIDIRVSIMPSVHDEDVVLRILDRQHLAQSIEGLTLARLGFDEATVARFKRLCAMPYGLVLVTGPTGSGKTTSLYAALSETRDPREKVITIEDPVEYQLPGVLQIPVNEKKGLTFAKGLRSILRHDPDRILVGEIRDQETAQIAVQSALTGHLVYTTVHANNAFDVLSRFSQLGVDPYDLAAALNGVLAQRLVRRLCDECARPQSPGDAAAALAGANPERSAPAFVRVPVGCAHCRGTGYRGRLAIGELLLLTPELKTALAERKSQPALRAMAATQGLVSLRNQVLQAVAQGVTSMEEADRVTLDD